MGVFICPCKIGDRVSESCEFSDYEKLLGEYNGKGVELVRITDAEKCVPFECGIYTYETSAPNVDMSYGSNWDFLECLRDFYDETDNIGTFSTTLGNSGIDGCISYTIATDMLKEFEEGHRNDVKTYIYGCYGEDYGNLIWYNYKQYMDVLNECVRINGIIRYC